MSEVLLQYKLNQIQEALRKGCRVFVKDVEIKRIDVVKGHRGAYVVINDSLIMYASQFVTLKIVTICPAGGGNEQ